MIKVAIVGGSGLFGRALSRAILADGGDVLVLSRDPERRRNVVPPGARLGRWSADDVPRLAASIAGMDRVVCVTGARVAPWPGRGGARRSSGRAGSTRSV